MLAKNHLEFVNFFKEINEVRDDGRLLYPLHEIVFMTVIAVLCGAESWSSIVKFANMKSKWLKQFFPFEHGIPSKSTVSRLFGLIDKRYFESWLRKWTADLFKGFKEEILALDGKSLNAKGKFSSKFQATHLVSLFATEMGIVLAQESIDEKTNEIPAMKSLLEKTDLSGAIVTSDAMGCQKDIAKIIRQQGGDYFLAVKQNQKTLHEMIEEYFNLAKVEDLSKKYTVDKGHGRIEERFCVSTNDVSFLKIDNIGWEDLKSIVMVESRRHINNKIETQKRYYITSLESTAELYLRCSRKHWSIENNLHWVLDVEFSEDRCLVRQDNAAENMGVVRKVILNALQNYKKVSGTKDGIKRLRESACWDIEFAQKILESWNLN